MCKLWTGADFHLDQYNILNYRPQFTSIEDHDETILDNMFTQVGKRDSIILLGDIVFSKEKLERIKALKCVKKTLVLGNHCTDHKLHVRDYLDTFDEIHSLYSKRNYWFSHCPIHPQEMRGKIANIHGHGHDRIIEHPNYISVSMEVTNYKLVSFAEIKEQVHFNQMHWLE